MKLHFLTGCNPVAIGDAAAPSRLHARGPQASSGAHAIPDTKRTA